jgi:hypothetical protein
VNSEQQRAVDQAIIDGRLVDAIAAYRAATGVGLGEAERYVRKRGAAVTGSSGDSSAGTAYAPSRIADSTWQISDSQAFSTKGGSLPASGVTKILWLVGIIVVASIVVPLLFTAGALFMTYRAISPEGLTHAFASVATIKDEPYYPEVVAQIRKDTKFKGALGAPITVDDGGVTCGYIHDDSVQHKANCTIPVHGPKAAGTVRVQIVDQAGGMDLGAWLDVGGRTIPIDS